MTGQAELPDAFADLERFVAKWAKPTTDERLAARTASTMDEITAFYDAMIVRADAALAHLEPFDLHALPAREATLLQLLLALVQASMAVEIQRQPLPPKTRHPLGVSLVGGAIPFGGRA